MVVVVDADVAGQVLGNSEGLNKSMEPRLSDKLLSHRPGHHTLFSSATNSPYWRLIRKGTAPAFKAENIKCAARAPCAHPLHACVGAELLKCPVTLLLSHRWRKWLTNSPKAPSCGAGEGQLPCDRMFAC